MLVARLDSPVLSPRADTKVVLTVSLLCHRPRVHPPDTEAFPFNEASELVTAGLSFSFLFFKSKSTY